MKWEYSFPLTNLLYVHRYLQTLKSYIHNKARPEGSIVARPEGSIVEGYVIAKCLIFCSRY